MPSELRSFQPLLLHLALLGTLLIPRVWGLDSFFIQDEQPWIDRSQLYTLSLLEGDLAGAARYPLSNHPAITLMTAVGPVMQAYGARHDLPGTYTDWPTEHKRAAAVWARTAWAVVTTAVLVALYACLRQLRILKDRPWWAAFIVVALGFEPWIWGISRTVSVDVVMALAVVGAFITAGVARERAQRWWFIASGAWWAVAFISKSPALITAPLLMAFLAALPVRRWRESLQRLMWWGIGALLTMATLWPPFALHPIARIRNVLARVELHSTVPENYLWPGIHPPLFIFTLSAFATVGILFYLMFRWREWWQRSRREYLVFDSILAAGLWHGLVLLYLQGDHARKNLPVLALLAMVGTLGWLRVLHWPKLRLYPPALAIAIVALHLGLIAPYWPHVLTSSNHLFPSPAGQRLLVDIGNGSRLAADYINQHDAAHVYATSMDSLIQPYLDAERRSNLRALPAQLTELDPAVTHLIVPASFPARVEFDPTAKQLLKDLANQSPLATLAIRDVPIFWIYAAP